MPCHGRALETDGRLSSAEFGLWAAWIEWVLRQTPETYVGMFSPACRQIDQTDGVRQLVEAVGNNPFLRIAENALNSHPLRQVIPVDWAEIVRALRTVWLYQISRPENAVAKVVEFNLRVWQSTLGIWNETAWRWLGLEPSNPSQGTTEDKRFAAPEWQNNPGYRALKEIYLLASEWLLGLAAEAGPLAPAERQWLTFHLRQFVDAVSPALSFVSNPVALRRALETGGVSLADASRNLMSDLRQGKLTMVDATAFKPGHNLAVSAGKVVYRNKLIELIQYEPKSEFAYEIPLLIVPPWINKFYILDLQPRNSMVKFLTEQGFTVFMVSWRNPDASMENTTIEDYLDLGLLTPRDVIQEIAKSPTLNVMGYCIGGTLLAMALAWSAARGTDSFGAATFIVSLQDFSRVGDTAVFLDESHVDFIEQQMLERGYLDSREMSNMFSLMRSNDLIWSNVVHNYLLGLKPPAFDLLYWNSDGTRMARAAHSWYLRNTYVENNLIKPGKVQLKGVPLDLGQVRLDIYAVGAEKDHIVPWDAAWRIQQIVAGKTRYVLASSGHIAGIINPPGGKGSYWTNDNEADTPARWRETAHHHEGSWWTDWAAWLAARSGPKRMPPSLGSRIHPPLQDAPGSYVLEK
jgi:polyhydroxyalkanoate synthase